MDGVRLTRPTILQTAAAATRSSTTLTAPSALPAGVLLVVAQGSHRIASWQHSGDGSADNGTAGSVHGFDPLVLADLLMPKSVLHDHLLDLTIGDCRLVGWPLQLAIEPAIEPAVDGASPSLGRRDSLDAAALRALSVVFVLPAAAASVQEAQRYNRALEGCKQAAQQLAYALRREEACGGFVSRNANSLPSGGAERSTPLATVSGAAAGTAGDEGSAVGVAAIGPDKSGGVGLGLGGGGSGGGGGGSAQGSFTSGIGAAPSSFLPAEGGLAGHAVPISSAATSHHAIKDGVTGTAGSKASASAGGAGRGTQAANSHSELDALLGAALRALQLGEPCSLRVGMRTDVPICTLTTTLPAPRLAAAAGGMPPPPPLRPYKTLLPLEEPAAIAQQLPPDASPLLHRLLRAINPLRSLEQLADETGITMQMMFGLVEHMLQWGKVRVIHPLTQDSVLSVHPQAPHEPDAAFVAQFGQTSPGYDELLVLFLLAPPLP